MKTNNPSESTKPKQQNVGQGTTYDDDRKTSKENIHPEESGQNSGDTSRVGNFSQSSGNSGTNRGHSSKGTGMSSESGSSQSEASWQDTGGSQSGNNDEKGSGNTNSSQHP
jgi:hypothetical protein